MRAVMCEVPQQPCWAATVQEAKKEGRRAPQGWALHRHARAARLLAQRSEAVCSQRAPAPLLGRWAGGRGGAL